MKELEPILGPAKIQGISLSTCTYLSTA